MLVEISIGFLLEYKFNQAALDVITIFCTFYDDMH